MTQAFTTYAFTSTGAITARTEPDRLADVINVKDYGAVGNGVTDDTTAIQLAFDAAYGSFSAPHGQSNYFANKPVFFPAGNYKITSQVTIRFVRGALIVGSGSGTTTITYAGAIAGAPTYTNLIYVDGMNSSRFEGISFVMTGGNALADKTAAFNLTYIQLFNPDPQTANQVNGSAVTFIDCAFSGATYGLVIGDGTGAQQCDMTALFGCIVDNCYHGVTSVNQNALNSGIYGGAITNCVGNGVNNDAGIFNTLSGVSFAGNGIDVRWNSLEALVVIGCFSESANHASLGFGPHYFAGCRHVAAGGTAGFFVKNELAASAVIESCYSSHGYFLGTNAGFSNNLYLVDLEFGNPDWTHSAMQISEWVTADPFTFAAVPTTGGGHSWRAQGLMVPITDSNTATWAATVAGSGSNHVTMRWNTSNWTVVGA